MIKKSALGFLILGGLLTSLACNSQTSSSLNSVFPFNVLRTPSNTPTITRTPAVIPTNTPLVTPTPAPGCPFVFLLQWGSPGLGNGQFNNVSDLDVDASGTVNVLDTGNRRVQQFDSLGNYLGQWNDNNGFIAPSNIVVSNSVSKIYVLDNSLTTGLIKVFDLSGAIGFGWNVNVNSHGLAVDGQAHVYVGEQTQVARYDYTGFNPIFYYNQGISGSPFGGVAALAADSTGNLYVAAGASVQKFNSSGQYVRQWGSPGGGNGQFKTISAMRTDALGNVYVVDGWVSSGIAYGRVQEFDPNGNVLCAYQVSGTEWTGLAFDPSGNIYLVDSPNEKIVKFQP
jgi:hypothetical protein